jgi:hypothetical protein
LVSESWWIEPSIEAAGKASDIDSNVSTSSMIVGKGGVATWPHLDGEYWQQEGQHSHAPDRPHCKLKSWDSKAYPCHDLARSNV